MKVVVFCPPQGAERNYADVCLVDVLRAHGYKVDYEADGPFWAMQDGNRFLEAQGPLGPHPVHVNVRPPSGD